MFKKTALLLVWGILSISTLAITTASLIQMRSLEAIADEEKPVVLKKPNTSNSNLAYASLPQVKGEVTTNIKAADARPEILYQYLSKRNSPLAPYANYIVAVSDNNGIDFRLPVAIAECESNLCQEGKFPPDSYNCWGYGIHSRGTLKFKSYEESIEKVIAGFKKFKDRGYMTSVEKLMELYTPASIEKGGSWAKCVGHFMSLLE